MLVKWRRRKPSFGWLCTDWHRTQSGEGLHWDCTTHLPHEKTCSCLRDCKPVIIFHLEGDLMGSSGIVKRCLFQEHAASGVKLLQMNFWHEKTPAPGFPPDISSRQNRCALWLTGLEGPENPDQFGGLGGMLLGRAARLLITLKRDLSCVLP